MLISSVSGYCLPLRFLDQSMGLAKGQMSYVLSAYLLHNFTCSFTYRFCIRLHHMAGMSVYLYSSRSKRRISESVLLIFRND